MKIIDLVKRGTDEPVALACGACGLVYALEHRELAERCCDLRCECLGKRRAAADAEAYERAEKISLAAYLAEMGDGAMVCAERLGGEGAYHTATDAADDGIAWAWACTRQTWPRLDALDIAEHMTEEMYEDAIGRLDVDGLQRALDAWLAEQPDACAWMVDERRVVVMREEPPR